MQAEKRPKHVELALTAGGKGSIIVNGVDLSHCTRAVTVRSAVGEATTVTLEIHGVRVEADAEAFVQSLPIAPRPRGDDPIDAWPADEQ